MNVNSGTNLPSHYKYLDKLDAYCARYATHVTPQRSFRGIHLYISLHLLSYEPHGIILSML